MGRSQLGCHHSVTCAIHTHKSNFCFHIQVLVSLLFRVNKLMDLELFLGAEKSCCTPANLRLFHQRLLVPLVSYSWFSRIGQLLMQKNVGLGAIITENVLVNGKKVCQIVATSASISVVLHVALLTVYIH
jgi:hypothetical protein